MSDIERELHQLLRREDPSPGFARRVLEKTEARAERRWRPWSWIPAAVAACLLVSVSGVYFERQRRAEQAKEQVMAALQITAQKLAVVERVTTKNLRKQER